MEQPFHLHFFLHSEWESNFKGNNLFIGVSSFTKGKQEHIKRYPSCFLIGNKKPAMGWSGGAMVLGKLPVPGRPTIWITVGQRPTALAVGAGGGCLDIFTLIYPFSPLSPTLWETARYRLKYCLKGPLNPKQPTNQPTLKYKAVVKYFKRKVFSFC